MNIPQVIAARRNSVCAVMRIRQTKPERVKGNKIKPAEFQVSFVGTAFGIVHNQRVLTAHHVLNDGQARDPGDKFFLFVVPDNGPTAYQLPVTDFILERPDLDFAILGHGPCPLGQFEISATPILIAARPDGSGVATLGFPAPVINGGRLDPNGNWLGGDFFLKLHANEGIVAAQYDMNGLINEFNVGWYHGESGGPVFDVETGAAISVMQRYRGIQTPHGIHPGPHAGRPLSLIAPELRAAGAAIL